MELIFVEIFLLFHCTIIMAAIQAPTKQLNDGNRIPVLALGTYGSTQDIAKMRQTINWAVEAGYRHIDTAALYRNEGQIGQGIKDVVSKGLVRRSDLFVTTKLDSDAHRKDQVVPALRASLARLGLDYVDLYLIHSPQSRPANIDIVETWQGMEEAKRLGLAKSIGVSNFNSIQLQKIMRSSSVVPAVNQIEVHPAHTRESLVKFCQQNGITVMAYSPFGYLVDRKTPNAPPPKIDDPYLVKLAQKYGKSTTQIVLRYLIDRDLIPIPKSTNEGRLRQNIDVFDFKLTPEEVSSINKFNKNKAIFGWQ
ncbi:aldo/keto reductase family domain-containing protein [Phthorimaea operculella]|nr:aldo/keto reductase family domain-containing protein [Phthorimaea operculella]